MKQKKKIGSVVFMALILVALMIAGCAAPPAAAPTSVPPKATSPVAQATAAPKKVEKVKVALPAKSAGLWWAELGKQKGFYKDEMIDLEPMIVKADISYPAAVAGEIDYTTAIGGAFLLAQRGAPLRVIMHTRGAGIWHLYGGPGIESVQDLKGKVVTASSRGTTSEYSVRVTLSKLGLDPKDVTFQFIPGGADNLAALKAGSIAAAPLFVPFSVMGADAGYKKLASLKDYVDFPGDGLTTNVERLKKNPGQVKGMLRASLKSLAYYKEHPDELVQFIMKEFAIDQRMAKITYDDVIDTLVVDGDVTSKQAQGFVDAVVFMGLKKEEVSLDKGLDLTLLKEVQKELKISR